MNKNTKIGFLLMLVGTFFTSIGQLYFKYGSNTFRWDLFSLLTNYNLILGLFLYGIGAGLLIISLKYGELSVIYPFVSLTFIWVTIISAVILKENINIFKVAAIIFIVLGVALIGRGSNHD